MKKFMKAVWILATSALAFSSCVEEQTLAPQDEQAEMVTIQINAGSAQTKTHLDPTIDGPTTQIKWNESETIELLEQGDMFTHATAYGTSKDGLLAEFTTKVKAATASTFNYSAVYPSTAFVDEIDNNQMSSVKLEIPTEQHSTSTSFDPSADLLVAQSQQTDKQPTELKFQFARPVAVLEMTLKGLGEETLESVVFSNKTANIVGQLTYDFINNKVLEYGIDSKKSVKIDARECQVSNGSSKVYFTILPSILKDFKVVVTTDKSVYTKEISGIELNATSNSVNRFGVTMEGAKKGEIKYVKEQSSVKDGDQIVLVAYQSKTQSSFLVDKFAGEEVTSDQYLSGADIYQSAEIINLPPKALILTLESGKNGFYLRTPDGRYLNTVGKNTETMGSEKISEWTLDLSGNDAVIKTKINDKWIYLRYYSNKYHTTNTNSASKFVAFKKTADFPKTPLDAPLGVGTRVNGNSINVSWEEVSNATSYTIICGDFEKTTKDFITNVTFENLKWATSYDVSVVANPENNSKEYAPSTPAIVKGIKTPAQPVITASQTPAGNLDYNGGQGSITYSVENQVDGEVLTAECAESWIRIESITESEIAFSYEENSNLNQNRTAKIKLNYAGLVEIITVTQNKHSIPVLNIAESSFSNIDCGGKTLTTQYSVDNPITGQQIAFTPLVDWIVAEELEKGVISLTISENPSFDDRTGELTISYTGAEQKKISVQQLGDKTKPQNHIYKYSFTVSVFNKNGNSFKLGDCSWNLSTNCQSFDYLNGQRFLNGNHVTLTTSDIKGTIKSITIESRSNKSSAQLSCTATVGQASKTLSIDNTLSKQTFEFNDSGELSLDFSQKGNSAIILSSIEIIYQ